MPKTYTISKEQAKEIAEIRKGITDKRIDKRLHAVQLRGEGMKNEAIAEKLDTVSRVVSRWVAAFCKNGIEDIMGGKYTSHNWNMSYDEEEAFLEKYKKQAEQGQIVEVSEIKSAYVTKVGHTIGNDQIYRVLRRHGWRKVMPRSKHPKKASDEVIEASKKLTLNSKK